MWALFAPNGAFSAAHPPRYVRGLFYEYHFATGGEAGSARQWWRREMLGIYLPPISRQLHS